MRGRGRPAPARLRTRTAGRGGVVAGQSEIKKMINIIALIEPRMSYLGLVVATLELF